MSAQHNVRHYTLWPLTLRGALLHRRQQTDIQCSCTIPKRSEKQQTKYESRLSSLIMHASHQLPHYGSYIWPRYCKDHPTNYRRGPGAGCRARVTGRCCQLVVTAVRATYLHDVRGGWRGMRGLARGGRVVLQHRNNTNNMRHNQLLAKE